MTHRSTHLRSRPGRTAVALATLAATPSLAAGAVISWQNPASGEFQTPANWSGGATPGAADQALFDVDGNYTVSFQASVSNQRLTVRKGVVTLNLLGRTYSLTFAALPALYVGLFTSDEAVLRIQNGALATTQAQIGVFAGSVGEAIVNGSNAVWSASGRVVIGDSGSGSVSVTDGAGFTCSGELVVGASQSGNGLLHVSGDNSRVICTAPLNVGPVSGEGRSRGGGADQGLVQVVGAGRIEAPSATIGPVGRVTGNGSLVSPSVVNNGAVAPGDGVGTLRVQGNYQQTASGELDLQIGGLPPAQGGTRSDFLTVTGSATCGGTVRVTLVNGYTPQVNDTITILTAASVHGVFSGVINAQPPPPGAGWQLVHSANQVRIRWAGQATLGDINNDGLVNAFDLTQLLGSWGPGPSPADINHDGFVNSVDLAMLLAAWTPTSG